MTDTYQSWVERVVGGRNAKPLDSGEIVKSSAGEPFGAVEFVQIYKPNFMAEVGKKGDKYIYHFYPSKKILDHGAIAKDFYEPMATTFLDVFKREDQIEADWVDEMKAWVVRVSGWTNHVWGDELALRVIEKFHELLTGERS